MSYSNLSVAVGDSDTATPTWTGAPQTQTKNGNLSYAIAPDNGRVTINNSTGIVAITSNALAADSGDYTVTATGTNNYTGTINALITMSIRKTVTAYTVSTFAGDGAETIKDGPRLTAQFASIRNIAIDSNGDLYVADNRNHRIRKIVIGTTLE